MSRYEVGDWVKVLRSDWPSEFPVGGVFQVKHTAPVPGSGAFLDDDRDRYFTGYELEPAENPWTVADAKVGDKIRVSHEETVFQVDGKLAISTEYGYYALNGKYTFELIEAAKPAPKVGDSFTPGLPVGTVLRTSWGRSAFRTSQCWVFSDKYEMSKDSFDSNWKIDYLPEMN